MDKRFLKRTPLSARLRNSVVVKINDETAPMLHDLSHQLGNQDDYATTMLGAVLCVSNLHEECPKPGDTVVMVIHRDPDNTVSMRGYLPEAISTLPAIYQPNQNFDNDFHLIGLGLSLLENLSDHYNPHSEKHFTFIKDDDTTTFLTPTSTDPHYNKAIEEQQRQQEASREKRAHLSVVPSSRAD